MLENLQSTGFKINLLLPCIPGPFRLPNRMYFLKQLYLQIAIRRAQVPAHCTFTALWWPLYWWMKVCTFDLSKTGNPFKFFHSLHARMWALAYMFLWSAQTVEQWFSIFPMLWLFNTVFHVVVSLGHKIILLHHGHNFVIVMNYIYKYLICKITEYDS